MGVASAVRAAALEVEKVFAPDHSGGRISVAAQVLASMPYWSEQRRLDVWEQTYLDLPLEETEVPFNLLEQIFEFGRANLYGGFDVRFSQQLYQQLASLMSAHGVEIDATHSVDAW